MAKGPENGPGPGALPDPDKIRIPDDISELDGDVWAWRAEQMRRRRPTPWMGPGSGPPWGLLGKIGPLLFIGLLMLAFLLSLASTVRPAMVKTLDAKPVATTTVSDGKVGGLLPPGVVEMNGATVSTRALRPAVLVLLPADGAPGTTLDALYMQSQSYGLPFALVGPPEREPLLNRTAADIGAGTTPVVIDHSSTIAESIGLSFRHDPTVVVVGPDGLIHAIVDNPRPTIRLESVLSRAESGVRPVTD